MLECINNKCPSSREGQCILDNKESHAKCIDRLINTEKKINLMDQVKKCVNYEEGYFELLKENEKLNNSMTLLQSENDEYIQALEKVRAENEEYKQINKNLSEELKNSDITNRNMQATIIELHEEMDIVTGEKDSYIKNLQISHNIIEQENSQLKAETTNLNELIEKKDIKIEKLEKELESLKEVVNEGNEQLETEYSNKIFIAEQRINSLNTEVACLKAFKEKDSKQIQNLKDTIKSMAAAL